MFSAMGMVLFCSVKIWDLEVEVSVHTLRGKG